MLTADCPHRVNVVGKIGECAILKARGISNRVSVDECYRCLRESEPEDNPVLDKIAALWEAHNKTPRAVMVTEWKTPADLPCPHRLPVLREAPCELCGQKELTAPVYGCKLHGECTVSVHGIRKAGKTSPKLKTCVGCDDLPERHEPSPYIWTPPEPAPDLTAPFVFNAANRSAMSLAEMFRGRPVFLVCGGPSLRNVDLRVLQERGALIAAVNNVAATLVRPHIWFSVDRPGRFHPNIWEDPAIMKFTKAAWATVKARQTPIPRRMGDTWVAATETPFDMPNTWFLKWSTGFDRDTFLTSPRPTWGCTADQNPEGKHMSVHSVMLLALRMLYWLGCRRVYLVGADFSMSQQSPYAFPVGNKDASPPGNNATYQWLDRRFHELGPHFRRFGYEVVNCTEPSGLTAFPRASLLDALKDATAKITPNPTVEGLYQRT